MVQFHKRVEPENDSRFGYECCKSYKTENNYCDKLTNFNIGKVGYDNVRTADCYQTNADYYCIFFSVGNVKIMKRFI